MSQWGWVGLAYLVTYGALAAWTASVVLRTRRSRRRLEELR